MLCGSHLFRRVATQSRCPDTPPSRRSPAPGRSPQSRRVHWGKETWGELGLRGWGLPWTHPHFAGEHRAPFQTQWLTSTPPRCGLHCLLPPPREGALRTPVLAPHSLLPAPLQGLLPGVTSDQDHVRGVVTGVTDLSLRLGAPCSHQLPLRLDPVLQLESEYPGLGWANLSKPSLPWSGF